MVRKRLTLNNGDSEFNDFLSEFQAETDRAAAVLGAAYLDDLLRELLLACFVDDSKSVVQLVENQRPLGTFSARLTTAYAFGLIDAGERFDLDQIRDIRNSFAHKLHGLSFKNDSLRDKAKTFKCVENVFAKLPEFSREYPLDARKRFDLAVALLAYNLKRRVEKAERAKPAEKAPPPPGR